MVIAGSKPIGNEYCNRTDIIDECEDYDFQAGAENRRSLFDYCPGAPQPPTVEECQCGALGSWLTVLDKIDANCTDSSTVRESERSYVTSQNSTLGCGATGGRTTDYMV